MTVLEIDRKLTRELVPHELVPHRRTDTAADEATALGLPADEVAKTVVLVTSTGYVRAVLPASQRLDLHKARRALGDNKARLATEAELAAAYPTFELGAVPPFGGPVGDRVVVDERLAFSDSAVFEAGSHSESVRLKTTDLLVVAEAEIADLCATEVR
jgi:Ala-tRNA(Pro) deacylase